MIKLSIGKKIDEPEWEYAETFKDLDKYKDIAQLRVFNLGDLETLEVEPMLKKMKDKMMADGRIYIETNNLLFISSLVQQGMHEGAVQLLGESTTHFTPKIMNRYLTQAGFDGVSVKDQERLTAIAYKPTKGVADGK